MDLLNVLRLRIAALPQGDYTVGLKAVLQHIESAEEHFVRGKESNDDSLFTDSIYRTNQAFEGSLKEAFRVIAGKSPSHETPAKIEEYFQNNNVFRSRVLAQFTNYRKEWRNASTHTHTLSFDDDEALLAIVTVTAFALVLVDQIIERVAFVQAKSLAAKVKHSDSRSEPLIERVIFLIEEFISLSRNEDYTRESELIGAISGYLTSSAPDLTLAVDARLSAGSPERPDVVISSSNQRVILEIKRTPESSMQRMGASQQVSSYMLISGISQAVVLFFRPNNLGRVERSEYETGVIGKRIVFLSTASA